MNPHSLRVARLAAGLSQAKLATLLQMPQARLSAWELNKTAPPPDVVERIGGILAEGRQALVADGRLPPKKRYRTPPRHTGGGVPRPPSAIELRRWISENAGVGPTDYTRTVSSRLYSDVEHSLTGIALFAGCGGLSLGMRAAGIDVLGFVENDPVARTVYGLNFPNCRHLGSDITKLVGSNLEDWPTTVDVLFGGPPCQGFSLAGKRAVEDPRNALFKSFAWLAGELRPSYIVLENVRLMTSMKSVDGEPMPLAIERAFAELGYHGQYAVVNAEHYGVPQFRERFLFLAARNDLDVEIALPPHSHSRAGDQQASPALTFRDATADLEPLEAGERSDDPLHWAVRHPPHVIAWLKDVPEGASAHTNPDPQMRPPSGYNTTYQRLRWDEPSSTIGTNFGMISGSRNVHPRATRSITVREALRCQTFPDDFLVTGSWGDIRRLVGNAVPPILARAIGEALTRTGVTQPR